MIYKIVDGEKKLFADVSKVQSVNGKTGEGTDRSVVLYAGDILIDDSSEDSIESVLSGLAGQIASGNNTVSAGDGIELSPTYEASIKLDPQSDPSLSLSSDGLKLSAWSGTMADFNALDNPDDGVYYITDDAV